MAKHPSADRELTNEERLAVAAKERREFLGSIAGAQLRAAEIPRDLLKALPFAVAGKVFADVLIGKIPVKTAREAADIIKVAVEVGRAEMGEGVNSAPTTADERKAAIESVRLLQAEIKARHEALEADEAGTNSPAHPLSAPIVALGDASIADTA